MSRPGGARGRPASKDLGGRKAFVVVTPGLEDVLVRELGELGIEATATEGGATIPASWGNLQLVCHEITVASGLRLRLAKVQAGTLELLARGVRSVPWHRFVHPRQEVQVQVTTTRARVRRTSAISKKVRLAIGDALRGPRLPRFGVPREPALVHVRIVEDRASVSIDCVGEPLHRHGWRQQTAKAPIRENLAAAVLRLGGWRPGKTLVDPMCGAGTLPLVALRLASGEGPRLPRGYAYQAFVDAPKPPRARRAGTPTVVLAADRDPGAVEATKGNAQRARVANRLRVLHTPFDELVAPAGPGLLVCNLPYGVRVGGAGGDERLLGFYRTVGHVLRERWQGWDVAMVAPDDLDPATIHRGLRKAARFKNGGLPVTVLTGTF